MLTLFHPNTGEVRVKGVEQSTNAILHPWVEEQIGEILKTVPEKPVLDEETNRLLWKEWQAEVWRRCVRGTRCCNLGRRQLAEKQAVGA